MNATNPIEARRIWSRILIIVGGGAMLAGALNPLRGAPVILVGNGLFAIGAVLGQSDRRLIAYRVGVFLPIAVGVAAMWWLTWTGGFGGNSGRRNWWGVLILPILIGSSMGIWGPASPRWLLVLAIVVGLFCLEVMVITLKYRNPGQPYGPVPGIVLGTTGMLTVISCINRLRNP